MKRIHFTAYDGDIIEEAKVGVYISGPQMEDQVPEAIRTLLDQPNGGVTGVIIQRDLDGRKCGNLYRPMKD